MTAIGNEVTIDYALKSKEISVEYALKVGIEKLTGAEGLMQTDKGALEALTESVAWTLNNSILIGKGHLHRPGKSDLKYNQQVIFIMKMLGLIEDDGKVTEKGNTACKKLAEEGFYAREWD